MPICRRSPASSGAAGAFDILSPQSILPFRVFRTDPILSSGGDSRRGELVVSVGGTYVVEPPMSAMGKTRVAKTPPFPTGKTHVGAN